MKTIKDVDKLCIDLATKLCLVSKDSIKEPYLMLPTKRDKSRRVSEQESKILLCQELETRRFFYSIETPTRLTYIQIGKIPMSARLDVTIYNKRDPNSRLLNVELKSQNPNVESFRKDFEKLVREGIPGLWFHTIVNANSATWNSIFKKVNEAFKSLKNYCKTKSHNIRFAFLVLNNSQLFLADIKICPDIIDKVERIFSKKSQAWTRVLVLDNKHRVSRVNPIDIFRRQANSRGKP